MPKKICAFGMDGFIIPMMKKFAAEGCLPNFERLLKEGVVNQTLPSFPVWTPTNWATLSTGAHTGTHGVTRWHVEVAPGKRVDSFDGRANNAERIWNALERAGLRSVTVHYPAAAPSGVKSGFVVDGFGHPGYANTDYEVASGGAYTTSEDSETIGMDHDGTAVRQSRRSVMPIPPLGPARDWANLPPSQSPPLESEIEIHDRVGDGVTVFHLLALDSRGAGYDRVMICRRKDGNARIADAEVGHWSDWAIETFGDQQASVRFKLIELSPDGKDLKLYRSQVTYADGFTYPDDLAADLISRFGPYQEHASMTPYTSGMTDFDTALEECEYQGMWFAEVANYMLHERGCSFFICHWHLYDYLNHIHLSDVDATCPGYGSSSAEVLSDQAMDYFRRAYQVGDRILGKIWEMADADTYVGVLGDHGAYPDIRVANIRKFLCARGFTIVKDGTEGVERDLIRETDIDWEKTRAYLKDDKGFDIFINAEAGPEFDEIERELVLALRTWVDEEVGRTPIAIALPKRDAYLFGQWGDQCGDVIFAWDHGYVSGYYGQWKEIVGGGAVGAPKVYGAHHGGFIPTQNDISSSFGSFLLAGSNLKKGYERPAELLGYIHAADVVPTFCHILGVSPPAQSQGTVAYDLFEGHEMVHQREPVGESS